MIIALYRAFRAFTVAYVGIVKLSRNLEFWRRNRSTLGCRINNLESGEGAE